MNARRTFLASLIALFSFSYFVKANGPNQANDAAAYRKLVKYLSERRDLIDNSTGKDISLVITVPATGEARPIESL